MWADLRNFLLQLVRAPSAFATTRPERFLLILSFGTFSEREPVQVCRGRLSCSRGL